MIDLREYYLDNIAEDDYCHLFFSLIEGVNRTYGVSRGEQTTRDLEFLDHDEIEAIEKFRCSANLKTSRVAKREGQVALRDAAPGSHEQYRRLCFAIINDSAACKYS